MNVGDLSKGGWNICLTGRREWITHTGVLPTMKSTRWCWQEGVVNHRLSIHKCGKGHYWIMDDPSGTAVFRRASAEGPFETLDIAKVVYVIRAAMERGDG